MRLIDADLPREQMEKLLEHHLEMCNFSADGATWDCIAFLDSAPTIDAVEVVRCKDCKHWGKHDVPVAGETDKVKACEWAIWMVGENGYCVYGERKDGDE